MSTTRRSLVLGFGALALTPLLVEARDDDSTPESFDKTRSKNQPQESTPVASPGTEEDPPLIDLLKYGAWGVASRDFEQTGEFPGYAIIVGTSIGAFPDPETAAAAMPAIRSVQDLDPYNQLELTKLDSLGDDQMFLWGQLTSQGVDLTVGLLIVERGPYAVLASGIGVAELDFRSDLVEIAEFILSGAEAADPRTKDELMDILPDPEDLPHLPTSDNFYDVSRERTRGGDAR
jgi:hypothetical protein